MSEETTNFILVSVEETPVTEPDGAKGGNPWARGTTEKAMKDVELSVEKLEAEMSKLLNMTEKIFTSAQQQPKSGLQLEEIELAVEINGSGQIKLVGSGGTAGAKGAIKLKFKRGNSV